MDPGYTRVRVDWNDAGPGSAIEAGSTSFTSCRGSRWNEVVVLRALPRPRPFTIHMERPARRAPDEPEPSRRAREHQRPRASPCTENRKTVTADTRRVVCSVGAVARTLTCYGGAEDGST